MLRDCSQIDLFLSLSSGSLVLVVVSLLTSNRLVAESPANTNVGLKDNN